MSNKYDAELDDEEEAEKGPNENHQREDDRRGTRPNSSSSPRKSNGPTEPPSQSKSRQEVDPTPSSASSQQFSQDLPASVSPSQVSQRRQSQDHGSIRRKSGAEGRSSPTKGPREGDESMSVDQANSDDGRRAVEVKVESQSPVKSGGSAHRDGNDLGYLYSVSAHF